MKRLILASASPRRKVIMKAMGLTFDIIPSNYDEQLDDSRSAQAVAEELGLGKALDVAKKYPDAYVIGSDSIVCIDGRQVAKPADAVEARKMLHDISGRTHEVITSLALVCIADGIKEVKSDTTKLTFDHLSDELIEQYIATGDPYDKAGGYARQHPLLEPHAVKIEGDVFTVTGLPVWLLRQMLMAHGIQVPNDDNITLKNFLAADPADQKILV